MLNQETKIGPNHCFTFRKYCKWFKYTCGYMVFYGYFFILYLHKKSAQLNGSHSWINCVDIVSKWLPIDPVNLSTAHLHSRFVFPALD